MEGFHLPQRQISLQKQPPEVFRKKSVLSNSAKFTEKHLCQSLFLNKVAGFNLWKERLCHRYFNVNFVKFLRTPFLQNTCGRLLLSLWEYRSFHCKAPLSLSSISLKKILQWVKSRKKAYSMLFMFSCSHFEHWKDKYSLFFIKNINNTQIKTKLLALT